MKRVFVYEYVSGGGAVATPDDAAELMPMGVAMRDALAHDLLRIDGMQLSVAVGPGAPRPPVDAEPVRPRAGEPAFDFVARQAALHDLAWVVAPESGGVLARLEQVVGPGRWLGCAAPALAVASSKRATLRRLAAHGVPTPLAFEHVPEVMRWVVKPDDGAGALATRVHRARDDAMADWDRRSVPGNPMTIEPWVEGEPLSLSVLCRARAAELLSVNRQHIAVDATGWVSFEGVQVAAIKTASDHGRALSALASQVVNAIPGLRGFIGIDLVWHPRCGPVVIEVNPRVTCAYVGLSAALGRSLAADVLADRAAEPLHG